MDMGLNHLGEGCCSRNSGDKSGRYGCATCDCLWTLGSRSWMAGRLGDIRYGQGFNADRGGLGISLHDSLVACWWRFQ